MTTFKLKTGQTISALTVEPSPERIKALRVAAGLSLKQAAAMFGYRVRTWQRREESGTTNTRITAGEFHLLMLVAGQHPEYRLFPVKSPDHIETTAKK